MFLTYQQMKQMCDAFASELLRHIQDESNDFEKERLKHASTEIFDLLKEKYDIPALDSAVLLLASGMELLNRCDEEIEKAKREGRI